VGPAPGGLAQVAEDEVAHARVGGVEEVAVGLEKAPFFALSNNIGQRAAGVEHFILYRGAMGKAIPGAPVEAGGIGEPYTRENDLFSGIH
ncbi:hypothetical protein AB0K48_49330, partial [Nonomuraea sp. NPDC055795]